MDTALREQVSHELNAELKSARRWLLVVGILMFVVDMVIVNVTAGLDPHGKNIVMGIDFAILGVFVALWWFAKKEAQAVPGPRAGRLLGPADPECHR